MMIILMFDDDYVGDFDNGELLATNSYMQLTMTLMVYACIEKMLMLIFDDLLLNVCID